MTDFAIREVTPTSSIPIVQRLAGHTVLVPRGGHFGQTISQRLTVLGARTVVAPVVNFVAVDNSTELDKALSDLQAGAFDWVVVTSATTVDVFNHLHVVIPESTKIAAIGETTEQALIVAGYRVDFVPDSDNSPRGFLDAFPEGFEQSRVLIPHSETSEPVLEAGVAEFTFPATFVSAYKTERVELPSDVVEAVRRGDITAILVSSGTIARHLADQLHPIPESIAVVCIGPRTAFDAGVAGLAVSATAAERSNDALIDALLEHLNA